MSDERLGDPFGTHRSLEPVGALPQPAWRLDNDMQVRYATEILVDVETLNLDAASFRQMEESCGEGGVGERILQTVRERGKQHNPVTGSGGMLLGRVAWVGSRAVHRGVVPGDRVATLASLSLTPLRLEAIREIRPASAQVDVVGQAVIFASAPFARMPEDLPERLALALFDVAGAAPQVARRVHPGDRVLVLGAGGKSGLLCCAEARRRGAAVVLGVELHEPFAEELRSLGLCEDVIQADARNPLAIRDALASRGGEVDVTFSCVNVEGAEMAAILATRSRGCVYFFAMSTSFSRAALGAEGVGKDIDLLIGNGFAEGHAEHTLELVRNSPALRTLLERRYG
ncbi:MAG: L-erythro-3,5-diaminohexanoate dehydrogenase [Myxococcales bacterium]|nr:L-erythro-3,5-diaminohexanoate dehydrogenase [Polyangiaceae bacterium]MDW8250577.1 L-erythro-3,5-diaminohexanoate dehydrogenase [Myxococcales bacterium]